MILLTIDSMCCLTGAPDKLINELKKKLTIANPKYEAAKKYSRWVGKKIPKKLYYFKDRKKGFFMPRGFARQAFLICIEVTGEKPEIDDKRREFPEHLFTFKGELRPYQSEALEAILAKDFGVLEAGTGSGKTVMALSVIATRKQPSIVIVHTKELMYQWAERIKTFLGEKAGLVGDGHFSLAPVTVAIVNSARRKIDQLRDQFGFILVDECHRVPASLFTDVVSRLDGKYLLGLSATAYRRENALTRSIYLYMGEPAHRIAEQSLQDDGAILKPEIISRTTSFYYRYRDNYAAMMTALTLDDARNRQIADDVMGVSKKSGGTILVVSDRVAHCEKLQYLLEQRGCKTALLTGRTPAEKRLETVEAIRSGDTSVLVSTLQLIGEGFDAPGLTTLFLSTPIKFSGRLKQVIGRILRPEEGKRARVYDYIDEKVGVLRASARQRQKTYCSLQ